MACSLQTASCLCKVGGSYISHTSTQTPATMAKHIDEMSTANIDVDDTELPEEDNDATDCVANIEDGSEEEQPEYDEEYDSENEESWPICYDCKKDDVRTEPVQEKWLCMDCKYRSGLNQPAPEPSEYFPSEPEPDVEAEPGDEQNEEETDDKDNEDGDEKCESEPLAKKRRQDDV